ncbi:hypothetical protein [Paracnuella aquatica]|uniref:hypothetical protein n=1 Tax=Paracnuella aquatica TaxID=2268757 RepID=UPI000F4F523C|nr:hypothetical protein [Paracnuella aquatica]RPD47265.1 hypothetical protein DRJ53_12195 [Paracnuella aquatica]
MRKSPLTATLPHYLASLSPKVYTCPELCSIIRDFAKAINNPLDAEPDDYLQHYVKLRKINSIELSGAKGAIQRYALHNPSPLEVGQQLKKGGYFSHQTAAYIHGLVDEETITYYVSTEASSNISNGYELNQQAIDTAFGKEQRKSGAAYQWENYQFILLTSLDRGKMGVEKKGPYAVTGLERTLLDITVRPAYCGGAKKILQAYNKVLPYICVRTLVKMLDKMDFTYPYHQSLGFYLSRAGYTGQELKKLSRRRRPFTFYIDYAIKDPVYSGDWNLFYPNALDNLV